MMTYTLYIIYSLSEWCIIEQFLVALSCPRVASAVPPRQLSSKESLVGTQSRRGFGVTRLRYRDREEDGIIGPTA